MSPIQRPTPRAPAQPLGQCLGQLERQWQSEGSLAALWQAWPEIAGAQLAPHCRPLALRGNTLLVGASQPQWLQALRYSRHQLLAVLRSRGYAVNQLQFHAGMGSADPRGLLSYNKERGIVVQAWGSLTAGQVLRPRRGLPWPSGYAKEKARSGLDALNVELQVREGRAQAKEQLCWHIQ